MGATSKNLEASMGQNEPFYKIKKKQKKDLAILKGQILL